MGRDCFEAPDADAFGALRETEADAAHDFGDAGGFFAEGGSQTAEHDAPVIIELLILGAAVGPENPVKLGAFDDFARTGSERGEHREAHRRQAYFPATGVDNAAFASVDFEERRRGITIGRRRGRIGAGRRIGDRRSEGRSSWRRTAIDNFESRAGWTGCVRERF